MQIQSEGSVGSSGGYVNFADLLTFDWQIALGDSTISTKEFLKMVKKLRGIVKINGEYVLIDEKELQNILRKIENPPNISTSDLLKASLSEDYQGAKVTLDKKVREMIRTLTENEAVALPQNLKATLRPYQERGYAWMYKNTQVGFGSLLADDMGLGKTLQVISLLLKFKEEKRLDKKKALVVVPTTLLGNWEREIQKFAPDLNAWVYHGPKRSLELQENEVILTSYGVARSDEKILNKVKWGFLIIDEAQNIKNTQTAQTKAIKKIKSDVRIAMSGTPVENRLSEYWSIFDFTNKGYLDSLKRFKDEFIEPIEKERSQEHLDRFQKVTAPFILRRVKSDKSIIQDLPDKIETDQICTLTAEQSALYQNIVNLSLEEIQKEDGMSRRGLIFQMMTALKQICNHPNQYLKKKEIDPELSGKTQLLISLLDSIYENDEKTLIFTQYKEMGDLLAKLIEERYHQAPLWLHGGTSRKKRDEMVQDFQTQSHIKIMLLSLKAGGTGLNLTAANNVIHYDLWWNPAVENQATDRAYRIGQKKNVMVYRMITQGTFEENINGMIKAKKELADLTVNTGENWVTEMSNEDLKDIFGLKG
jgi:SNF2 family DNA or RNA helicase